MKISLDLLPEDQKKELKRSRLFRKIIWFEIMFLFPFFVMVIILLNNLYILNYQKESLIKLYAQEQGNDKFKELKQFQDSFKNANEVSLDALNFQTKHFHWINVIEEINTIIPSNVSISNISTKEFQIILVGKANNRDDLLSFQAGLQKSECFKDINLPLSGMVQKNNVDFQIDFTVKDQCLTKSI
jgi:Tfp pilus assembly protein PilN